MKEINYQHHLFLILIIIFYPSSTTTEPSSDNQFNQVRQSSSTSNEPPKLIVVSFDAFRPKDINHVDTPNLFKLSNSGVNGHRMKSQFTTKTYPNHMSIATGLHEETHGIVHNFMFDPVLNATFDDWTIDDKWWDYNPDSLPIWIANEIFNDGLDRNSGVVMWPGSESSYFGGKRPRYLEKFATKANWNRNIDLVIDWMTNATHPANCIFVYLNEPDNAMHRYGPDAPETKDQVRRVDSFAGNLIKRLQKANLYQSTNLIFLSDHGMAEVTEDRVIELNAMIPRYYYEMYGRSPVLLIQPKAGKLDIVYDTLKNQSKLAESHFQVYRKSEVPPEYHYSNNRRILDIVVVADEGYDVIDEMSNLERGSGRVWGNHGYNNSLESMRPLFVASGPAFKDHFDLYESFENIDLYPMMLMVLQILGHYPSQGSLQVVHQMLRPIMRPSPSSTDNLWSLLSVLVTGFGVIIVGSCCVIFCSGCGRPRKRVDTTWDAGVTEFDLTGTGSLEDLKYRFVRQQTDVQPESVLLLDDLDDEEGPEEVFVDAKS